MNFPVQLVSGNEKSKMILDLTKPAPPTYFPPRCSVPEKVVKAVNLEALQDYKGSQKVLKEVQWPESTFSRLCWSYSAVTTCQAAFQPFSCSRAPENLFRGNGKVFNGHTDSSFDSIGYGWCRKGLSDAHYAASSVSDALAEKHLDDAAIDQAVNEHLIFDEPMGDLYASGPYRVEIAKVDGGKALKTARDRGQS